MPRSTGSSQDKILRPGDVEFSEITYLTGATLGFTGMLLESPKTAVIGLGIIGARFLLDRAHLKRQLEEADDSRRNGTGRSIR